MTLPLDTSFAERARLAADRERARRAAALRRLTGSAKLADRIDRETAWPQRDRVTIALEPPASRRLSVRAAHAAMPADDQRRA